VAVDDTGAGYAGLQQLVRLKPDIIKLDGSLVSGVHHDPGKRALVDAIVHYARHIGALVCAEGVEELDELRAVADLDVAYGQGYALARPGPPWPAILAQASETCTLALRSALRDECDELTRSIFRRDWHGDLTALMRGVTATLEIDETTLSRVPAGEDCVETVACQGADEVGRRYAFDEYRATERVVREREALHVSVFDPASDPAEVELLRRHGLTSLLMLPVIAGERTVGLLELRTASSRIWTRSDLQRAWIVAYQLGHVMAARESDLPLPALDVTAFSC
jgi:GAF domain-containing protein